MPTGKPSFKRTGGPRIAGGAVGLCNYVNMKYRGRLNTPSGCLLKMGVSRLKKGELPAGVEEMFPPPHANGEWSKLDVDGWIERNLIKSNGQLAIPGLDDQSPNERLAVARAIREEARATREARAEDKAWVKRLWHEAEMDKFAADVWPLFWNGVETELPAKLAGILRAAGITEDIAAGIMEKFNGEAKSATDRVQRRIAEYAKVPERQPKAVVESEAVA